MNKILVTDTETNLINILIQNLLNNNYQVKLLTKNSDKQKAIFNNQIEIIDIDLTSNVEIDQTIWTEVNHVICLEEKGLNNFIQEAIKNLPQPELILFDFREKSLELREIWGAVDDVVMGGVSQSNFKLGINEAIFTGFVSTENNGGFASVRSKNFLPPWDLSAYQGIQIRVKGDGQRYKFITRCEGKWDGISYCYSFDTLHNVWTTINIPFADLIPVFRAKTVSNAGKFDSSKVYSLQFMLSKFEYDGEYNDKFQEGLFSLEIESVQAYGNQKIPHLILNNGQEYENLLKESNLNYNFINPKQEFISDEEIVKYCLDIINS